MSTTRIRLWFIGETELARHYCKFDPTGRGGTEPDTGDLIWIPKSICLHTSKRGAEHTLELPDWFIEKEKL